MLYEHFTSYWRGRKREPGIHCVRMRQLCDAADASTVQLQCDAADVTNRVGGLHVILVWLICFDLSTMAVQEVLCRLCHESGPSKRVSEARNSLAWCLCYQKKSPLPAHRSSSGTPLDPPSEQTRGEKTITLHHLGHTCDQR